VKAGDVLAYLDTTTLLLEIERTQSELDAARRRKEIGIPLERDLENARDVLADAENKFRSGNLAESELNKQRRAVQQLQQRVNLEKATEDQLISALENRLKLQRVQLDATTIKARINGQIAEVFVNAEQFIGDRTIVATMITDSRVVEAKVSEEHYSDLKIGQHASVRFLGLGPQEYGASVTKILPTADPVTQRYGVHLAVDLDPTRLAPGLTGEASIITGVRENTLIIPRRALFGDSVYLVADGRVEQRRIETGYTSLNAVEVVSGLEEGDFVIVDQLQQYRPGDRVRVQVEAAPAP
jgi:RND family efflux transporter MFP subunit